MTRSCPRPVISTPTTRRTPGFSRLLVSALLSLQALTGAAVELKPHQATYTTDRAGFTIDMEQTLKPLADDRWQLRNYASLLFISVEESARFRIEDNTVVPLRYDYDNSLNHDQSSKLRFDWEAGTVVDTLHDTDPLALDQPVWDGLSYQAQLRLDLMRHGSDFGERHYQQVDQDRLKHYVATWLGEEQLKTKFGTFNAVKLEDRRPGRDEKTLIWLAKDWDYMVLRLQRVEDGEPEYRVDLKAATLDGKPITGL